MEKYRLVAERKVSDSTTDSADDVGSSAQGEAASTEATKPPALSSISETVKQEDEGEGTEDETEVRITQQGKPRNYITYAMNLFSKGSNQVVLKAMGRAINKAVTIAEILKRKMPLHQITSLSSCEIVDVFEPLEEGLDVVESRRYVSCMAITLSIDGVGMDVNDIGYQPPLPPEEIQPGDLKPPASIQRPDSGGSAGPSSGASNLISS
uniref:DNA/RNA-binding protein Alba-like domain-containing protein n=1 Tax=Attheya septentrionalis TaxID=420275 RepID=A0A7S2XUJ7_9STRA|mmetsp:Transcript_9687/g.17623  ORF Transcript_9687/g.17623 Transcript_9687/m.17623 type:complete len:209 (+) Transcript_9687:456-1082(+)|eukprot:CAMPEP_0198288194 /NCGR_PEP_ID=MMETSP1449-20131203/6792_1 /TAXON_ID=420275 /ORGANISM="Attheya septentrionalis, Strain CCMP2084" /LENGTH=208 /DNA_ID=CAMNT_0043986307 /DNA_START=440 /DNA_END=1066 /DNA_ORIENTATION=-